MHITRAPKDISPTRASAVPGLAPVVPITTARCTSATTVKELWRNKVYNSLRIHGEVLEGERTRILDSAFIGLRVACLGFCGFTFY